MSVRIPRELHLPVQVLWFYSDDLVVMVGCYIVALIVGGWMWACVLIGPILYMRAKRGKPRGYFAHLMIQKGMVRLARYPSAFIHKFHE